MGDLYAYHDLTNAQWAAIAPLLPPPKHGGRKREVDLRAVVNAIRYLRATGCGWRQLPERFPRPSTVRHYYDRWRREGVWQRVEVLLEPDLTAQQTSMEPRNEDPAKGDCETS